MHMPQSGEGAHTLPLITLSKFGKTSQMRKLRWQNLAPSIKTSKSPIQMNINLWKETLAPLIPPPPYGFFWRKTCGGFGGGLPLYEKIRETDFDQLPIEG